MRDLYIGYNECNLAESSFDLTTFQSPFRALWLFTLPMGWTNSIPIFHNDITYNIQLEIPEITILYIKDVPICGPAMQYLLPDGSEEWILRTQESATFFENTFKVSTLLYSTSNTAAAHSVASSPFFAQKKLLQLDTAACLRDNFQIPCRSTAS